MSDDSMHEPVNGPSAQLARRATDGGALTTRDPERYDRDRGEYVEPVPRETDDTRQIAAALGRAQAKFGEVVKRRKADAGPKKYSYANLADVCRETLPALQDEGIFPSWRIAGTRVFFRITHAASGQFFESDLQIVPPDARGGVQALGSALSYIRRYLYVMMLGIVPLDDHDDDGGAAMAAGKMTGELVRFVLECAESGKPEGRAELIASMKKNREPAAVQDAAQRLFDERAKPKSKTPATA